MHDYIGNACRKIATSRLPQQFSSPEVAEKELEKQMNMPTERMPDASKSFFCLYAESDDLLSYVKALMSKVKADEQSSVLSLLYSDLVALQCGIKVPNDYLELSLHAFKHLKENRRANVLYKLAKAIGEVRNDGSDTKLPCKKMPMGLLEHIANFYTAEFHQQVRS